jgi:hypothetical protein
MFDANSPEAQRARALAESHLDALFAPDQPTPPAQDGSVDAARFTDFVEILRRPCGAADLREGLLIQGCVEMALRENAKFLVIGTQRVTVTENDRAAAIDNVHRDLGEIAPPRAGRPVGKFEFDIVAVDRVSGALLVIDVKRAARDGVEARIRLRAASLAARRSLLEEGVTHYRCTVLRIRWYSAPTTPQADVVTRQSVDEALGAPVRALVDHATHHFRIGLDRRLRAVVDGIKRPDAPSSDRAIRVIPTPTPAIDEAAILRAFARTVGQKEVA